MSVTLTLPRKPTTDLLLDVLKAAVPMPVGLGAVPRDSGGTSLAAPFYILHPLWVTFDDAGWGERRHDDVTWVYQVDVVSRRADQREWMRDRMFEVILGKVDGGWLAELDTDTEAGRAGVRIIGREVTDDDVPQPAGGVFSSLTRFAFRATRRT